MQCLQCQSELLIDVDSSANSIRCAACGSTASRNHESAEQANRLAWRSLWLGLSSIVFLCFTGIPAIWLGIRSLLQMRFTQKRIQDQRAAVVGVAMGLLFGILGSAIAIVAGLLVVVFSWTTSSPETPEEILAFQESIGKIELPDSIQPVRGRGMIGQFKQTMWDDSSESKEDQSCRIRIVRGMQNSQIGRGQIAELRDMNLGLDLKIEPNPEISELSWQFCGKPIVVVKTVMKVQLPDSTLIRYVAKTIGDNRSVTQTESQGNSSAQKDDFGIGVVIREPSRWSEDDVKAIIESFQPTLP